MNRLRTGLLAAGLAFSSPAIAQAENVDSLEGLGIIGARLSFSYGLVLEPYKGSPADRAGVVSGDEVLLINGREFRVFPDGVRAALGGEVGTSVELTIKREGHPEPIIISIERGVFAIPEGKSRDILVDRLVHETRRDIELELGLFAGLERNDLIFDIYEDELRINKAIGPYAQYQVTILNDLVFLRGFVRADGELINGIDGTEFSSVGLLPGFEIGPRFFRNDAHETQAFWTMAPVGVDYQLPGASEDGSVRLVTHIGFGLKVGPVFARCSMEWNYPMNGDAIRWRWTNSCAIGSSLIHKKKGGITRFKRDKDHIVRYDPDVLDNFDEVEMRAEYTRLSGEMRRHTERTDWHGADRIYKDLLEIERTGVIGLSYYDNIAGSNAAQHLGDVASTLARLKKAKSIDAGLLDHQQGIDDIEENYGLVELILTKKANGEVLTVVGGMPFDNNHRKAIEWAQKQLETDGEFRGFLPDGNYEFGSTSFTVDSEITTPTRIEK